MRNTDLIVGDIVSWIAAGHYHTGAIEGINDETGELYVKWLTENARHTTHIPEEKVCLVTRQPAPSFDAGHANHLRRKAEQAVEQYNEYIKKQPAPLTPLSFK